MKPKLLYYALALVVILTLSSACSALSLVNPPPDNQPGKADDAENGVDEPSSIDSDESQDTGDVGELLTCYHVETYTLSFDHTLTVNEEGTSLTHILKHGGIALQAETDPEKFDTQISTINPQELTFEYLGVIGPCSVDAGGTVIVSAEGFCDAGVVYLNIKEDWQETEGNMTCEDAVVPFSVPGQVFIHSGASGMGEEFLVTDDDVGHTVMREFLGGEGYHSWTLMSEIATVPLIDED